MQGSNQDKKKHVLHFTHETPTQKQTFAVLRVAIFPPLSSSTIESKRVEQTLTFLLPFLQKRVAPRVDIQSWLCSFVLFSPFSSSFLEKNRK